MTTSASLLLERFPELDAPWTPLIDTPTPVRRLAGLGAEVGHDQLWLKSEAKSGALFGGNKLRSLEFLIPAALAASATRLITFGDVSSNHALATSLYGRHFGLSVRLFLCDHTGKPREVREAAQARFEQLGAEVRIVPGWQCLVRSFLSRRTRWPGRPRRGDYAIPLGGASPTGALGHVNAALELCRQIDEGDLPAPAAIFVPLGSGGTVAGLAAGLHLLGRRYPLVAVNTAQYPGPKYLRSLIGRIVDRVLGTGTPCDRSRLEVPQLMADQWQPGYGQPSEAGKAAARRALESEGLAVDLTYSGKALASFLAYAREKRESGPLLFWHTCPDPSYTTYRPERTPSAA